MQKGIYILWLMLAGMGMVQAQQQPIATATGFQYPESVNSDGKYLYVSSLGATFDPAAKDGDGFISRLDSNGKMLDEKFITGVNAPKGMAIVQQVLYVTDIDSIKGFRLSDGARVFALGFNNAKTAFLNDLTVKDAHTLFASATDIGKIFEVQLGKQPAYKEVAVEKIKGANGLTYDAATQQLYVVSIGDNQEKGKIGVIKLAASGATYKIISDYTGFLDGAALLPGNRLLFTDWVNIAHPVSGTVNILDLRTGKITVIANQLQGSADLLYLPSKKITWVPVMAASKLAAYQL